jgi:peptidyl-prolyl cis-trans isomerase D
MIIIGFVFTGFEGQQNVTSSNIVSEVDGTPVTYKEYQLVLNQEIQRAAQIFGNRNLSKQETQILGQRVLGQLVQKKVLSNFVRNHDAFPPDKEISKQVKELPYFQTNKQFDITKYKGILAQNRLNPSEFEKQIAEDLAIGQLSSLLFYFPLSKSYHQELDRFKKIGAEFTVYTLAHSEIKKLLKISDDEIKSFLAEENAQKTLEGLYNRNIAKYEKPEERKASHILFAISDTVDAAAALKKANAALANTTDKNFATQANSLTDDPSGKKNGGSLGWFRKGIMAPEFEKQVFSMKVGEISKPVKTSFGYHIIKLEGVKEAKKTPLEDVKNELAETHLLSKKNKEVKELTDKKTAELNQLLKEGSDKINQFIKENNITVNTKLTLNILEPKLMGIDIPVDQAFDYIKQEKGSSHTLKEPLKTLVITKTGELPPEKKETDPKKLAEQEKAKFQVEEQKVAYSVFNQLIKHLSDKATIKTNPQFQNGR